MPPKDPNVDDTTRDRVMRLHLGNQAAAAHDGATNFTTDLPMTWQLLGYTGVAKVMGVGSGAVRHYWADDLARGFSQSLPVPDGILQREAVRADGTTVIEMLPGWTERTIREWMPFRVGAGNHTTKASPGGRRGRGGEPAAELVPAS